MANHVASASIEVRASTDRVWRALTDPDMVEQYMFGSRVSTTWEPGSPITWAGAYEGKPYEDKGEVLEVEPSRRLRVTHYSPLSNQPDVPENYHTLTYELTAHGDTTTITLTQDGNDSAEQAEQFSQNWASVLEQLKAVVD